MLKRKGIITILTVFTVSILAVIIVFSKMNTGATTQQDESLKYKTSIRATR